MGNRKWTGLRTSNLHVKDIVRYNIFISFWRFTLVKCPVGHLSIRNRGAETIVINTDICKKPPTCPSFPTLARL